MCTCGICGKPFPSHTALSAHIFADHGSNGVNWNSRMPGGNGHPAIVGVILAVVVALSLMLPAKAQEPQPTPTVGGGPSKAVEHKLFLPFVAVSDEVDGQGRYWGGSAGKAQPDVSWRPSGS